jgi:hypothetical protein
MDDMNTCEIAIYIMLHMLQGSIKLFPYNFTHTMELEITK